MKRLSDVTCKHKKEREWCLACVIKERMKNVAIEHLKICRMPQGRFEIRIYDYKSIGDWIEDFFEIKKRRSKE